MDSIGESTSNHMSLDDPSSSDNSPRGISDEPVSRRRNSPEDIDSSRPRKRVAVMEDSTGEITAVFCLTNGDNEQGASAAPNLSPITTEANCAVQTESPLDDDIADFTITKLEKAPVEASSNSTETMNQPLLPSPDTSGSDSDSQTLCSTPRDPDVIEIEDDYDDNPVHPVESTDDIEEISHHTGSGEDAEIVLKRLLGNSEESDLLSENAVEIFVTDGKKFAEILAKKHITLAFLPRILDILVKYNIPFNEALEGMGEAIKQIKTYSGDYVHFSALVISKDTIVLHCAPDQESCVQSPQFLTCIERLVCDDSVMRRVPLEGSRVTNIMLQLRTFLIGPKGLLPNDTELEAFTLDRVIETWQENILLENINGITQQILSMVHRIDSESQVVQEIISTITGYWLTLRDTLYKFFKRDIGTDLKDYREFTQLLEIYTSMASQLHAMQPDNPALEQKLIGYIPYPVGQELSPRLKVRLQCINSAYRFPIFYEMMRSGRIGDRIHGVTNMTQILLQVFKENQQIGSQSPIVRYFAEFITENGVLEYLIGPDSHETLISRGANIPGYLIATRLVTDKHIDLMWRPFIENENRHLFRALLQMQKEIFPVMQPEVALSMNSRIAKVPLSSFCNGTIDYLNLLVDKIPSLCIPTVQNVIRVMQLVLRHEDAFENQQLISLFTRAEEMLAKLCSKHSDSSLRKDIFRLCVENIRAYNENTTGSLSALNTIFRYRPAPSYRPIAVNAEDDIRWLVEECDFGSLVVEELIHYIDDHRIGNTSFRARQLRIRLDLLALVLLHEPNSIDIEQQEKLWSYLVGHKALGPAERELACEHLYYELNEHFKDFQAHPILDMVYRKLLPELDSQFFATPVLELAKKSLEYLNSNPELVSEDSQTVVINGIEVLWRIVLEAPDDSIERNGRGHASSGVKSLYSDSIYNCRKTTSI
ncbi:hypothetical protein BZA77DRAFT_99270 [Pyronema omphalodes]|nr:hypothetical protein BZA77DRAFT_99270 [Pyronema omphalodes]